MKGLRLYILTFRPILGKLGVCAFTSLEAKASSARQTGKDAFKQRVSDPARLSGHQTVASVLLSVFCCAITKMILGGQQGIHKRRVLKPC